MESEVSTGGAAQLVVPQHVRGCAASSRARVRSATLLLVSRWEAPVQQQPGSTAEKSSAVPVPMRCDRSSAHRAMRKQGHARIPRAMARVTSATKPPFATRFLS